MKNLCKLSIYRGFLEKLRSEADSNRCRRFCRPVTKPLIHRTIMLDCECKYTKKSNSAKTSLQVSYFFAKIINFTSAEEHKLGFFVDFYVP